MYHNSFRRVAIGLVVLVLFSSPVFATPRVLIVGDSWAAGVWATRAMDEVFQEFGMQGVESEATLTAVSGSKASQWAKQDWLNFITYELAVYPTIDTVHIIIGGNDVLGRIQNTNVFTGLNQYFRNSWWNEIKKNVQTVCNYCLLHPQIKHVVIGGYDYLNRMTAEFVMSLMGQKCTFGGMSQYQVNKAFIEVGQKMAEIALSTPNVGYVQNFGLLQWYFNWPAGSAHPGLYPTYNPWPGGNAYFPMPDASFDPLWVGSFALPGDGIHPNENAHKVMLRNAVQQFYTHWYGSK